MSNVAKSLSGGKRIFLPLSLEQGDDHKTEHVQLSDRAAGDT